MVHMVPKNRDFLEIVLGQSSMGEIWIKMVINSDLGILFANSKEMNLKPKGITDDKYLMKNERENVYYFMLILR